MAGLTWANAREFDVGGGELKPALDAYIAQSGVQLIYKVEDVKDLSTRGVKGKLAARRGAGAAAGRHATAHPARAGRGDGADRAGGRHGHEAMT